MSVKYRESVSFLFFFERVGALEVHSAHTHTKGRQLQTTGSVCVFEKKKIGIGIGFQLFTCQRVAARARGRLTLESVIWGWIAAELTVRALKGSCVPVWGGVKRGGNAEEEGESSVHLIVVFLDCTRFA
jgi:hypothetical protein